jgi:hypothetical protein
MPALPALPPLPPPPHVNVDEQLRVAMLPPWVETATIERLSDDYQRAVASIEKFEAWSRNAATGLHAIITAVREHGASNLLQIIESVDASARRVAAVASQAPDHTRDARKAAREMRKSARDLISVDPESAATAFAMADTADKKVGLMKRREDAYRRVLDTYRAALRDLVAIRDANLVEASSAATFALIESWDPGPDGSKL